MEIPFTWPTDWQDWIAALDTWLSQVQESYPITASTINNIDALKDYAHANGFAVITDEAGNIVEFVKMEVLDPANSTQSLPVPIQQFAESAEVAGTVAGYTFANGTTSYMHKAALVGTVLAGLNATIQAGQVLSDIQQALEDSVTPYTKDGENVPIYLTKHNNKYKTYLPEGVIEAIRSKAVELGVFPGQDEPGHPDEEQGEFKYYKNDSVVADSISENDYDEQLGVVHFKSTVYCREETGASLHTNPYIVYNNTTYTPSSYIILAGHYEGGGTVKELICLYDVTSAPPYGSRINCDLFYEGAGTRYNYAYITPYKISAYVNGVLKSLVAVSIPDSYRTNDNFLSDNNITVYDSDAYSPIGIYDIAVLSKLGATTSTGVHGIITTSSSAADDSLTIADLLPDAWRDKIALATPTIDDLFKRTNYLPMAIETIDPFGDGTSDDSSDTQEGEITDPLKNPIIDLLDELIKELINDPDNPIPPDFPVDDSGDTPPATPPVISASANGLWKIYNPTLQNVQDFGAWLWSTSIVDQLVRMFNSPIDAVIGFHMIYCTPIRGAAATIKCGYLDSNVTSQYTVANQYVELNCGTVTVPEYYGTALDYTATKLALYLPFVGIVPLSTAVCMGSVLEVIYRIDVLTGTCLAQVKVIKTNSNAVMYAFEGNCAVQVPLTATTYTGMVSTLINGIGAGLSMMTGDIISAAGDVAEAVKGSVSNLSGTKQSGTLGANAGALGVRIPYLIITHPVAYDAFEYNTQYGFPLNQTVALGTLNGYTRVKDIHLSGIPCTDDELEQIEALLKDGVIIN